MICTLCHIIRIMKKIAFLLIVLFGYGISVAQEVKPLEEYEKSLKEYYSTYWKAHREEYKGLNEKKVVSYLPDVGFVLGLPSISWRSSEFFRYRRDRDMLEKKLKSLDMSLELEMNAQLLELKIAYEKLMAEKERIKVAEDKYIIQAAIYAIGVECCEKRECTPEVCKTKELERYEASEVLKLMRIGLKIKVLELESLARYGLKMERLKP
jgi:hypothetical protein